MMWNICDELKCPMRKNGCREFTTSYHCPVGFLTQDPTSNSRNAEIKPNGYWLFAEETADININQLRTILETEVLAKSCHLRKV